MAGSLSAEKQKNYKEKFSKFDRNGDGKMSKDELRSALKMLNRNPTDARLNKLMTDLDTNENGFLEYDEFEQMMINLDAEIDKGLKDTFDKFDKDKNGFITADELDDVFQDLGVDASLEELEEEIKKVDVNKDGMLNFLEFKKLFGRI